MHPPYKLLALILLSTSALGRPVRAVEPEKVRDVSVADRAGGVDIVIRADRAPSYSVFKLQDPNRLVIDMDRVDVSDLASPIAVHRGGVVSVSAAQYRDAKSSVGRVIVTLDGPRKYEVTPRGDALVVRVDVEGQPSAEAATAAAAVTAPAAEATAAPAEPAATAAAPAAEVTAASAPPQPGATEDRVVSRRVDEEKVARAARSVLSVRSTGEGVLIATDGGVARVEVTELRDPPRLALDLAGVTRAPRSPASLTGPFAGVRFGKNAGGVRVVLDAADGMPEYRLKRVKGGLAVVAASVATAPQPSGPAATPAAPVAPAPEAKATRPQAIAAVKFTGDQKTSRIEIGGRAPYTITRPDARTVVLTLEGAHLSSKKLERSLDTTALKGPVQMVSSFNQPGRVRVVATLDRAAVDRVVESPDGLVWSFAAEEAPVRIEARGDEVAGFAAEAPAYAAAGAPAARGYSGRRITLEFHEIEIRNLLRLIADVSKKNIIVADDVTGKVTISLRNVPWDQALELVLRSKGLGKEEMGNVVRVAKLDDITREQKARAEAEKARLPMQPLKVRILPVNFARANDLVPRVKDVLTERGTVSTDDRTNVLIVKDVQEAIVRAEGLVRNLDSEIPQVLIEARIVEASSNFNRALGVQWGGNAVMNQANGNPTGLLFPYNAGVTGAAGGGPTTGTAGSPNYAVNLPAAIGQGSGGGLGFTFGTIGGAFNLNLRLSALENTGTVKTISAPKIATIDNREATIGQGISIPFSQTSASGVNTTFIEAKLELKVTPHVSSDGNVLLKIKATNNSPNPQLTGANGQPSIAKREAETEVLVKDGDTTVIGGIYTRQTSAQQSGLPWLSKIPVLGYFFRSQTSQDDHTELLIFITPRILNRSATAVANGN